MKVSALLAGGTGGDLNFLAPIPCITGSPPFFLSSSPVGYFWEILVGMCRPVLKILTLFLTTKFHYPHSFSDLASKSQTRFQT